MKTLQFAPPTPAQDLQIASESMSDLVTAGMQATSNFTSRLVQAMPNILNGFSPVKDTLTDARQAVTQMNDMQLNRDQKKFMEVIASVPYSDLRELRAFVPAGMKDSYLAYLSTLLPATEYALSVRSLVVEPFMMLCAKLVSDKQGTIATTNHVAAYTKLAATRKRFTDEFAKHYAPNSNRDQTTIKFVVERNNDWKTVLQSINTAAANLEAIDLPGIQRQLATCSSYLDLLHERLKSDEISDTTREVAQGLADGAYTVAEEMQFLSGTYFRTLQLTKAVDDTVKHVIKSMG